MTPDERGDLYGTLEEVLEKEGLEGLAVIVDALATLTAAEAQEEDDDAEDWQEASRALENVLVNYINIGE